MSYCGAALVRISNLFSNPGGATGASSHDAPLSPQEPYFKCQCGQRIMTCHICMQCPRNHPGATIAMVSSQSQAKSSEDTYID